MFGVTRRCVAAAISTLLLAGVVGSGASLAAEPDHDGDGYVGTADCKPFDPAVHPGAVDRPDLSFEDINCDGIDGDVSRSIFVAKAGDDGATGTPLNPVHSIQHGIDLAAAATPPKDVLVAGGTYNESIVLKSGVSFTAATHQSAGPARAPNGSRSRVRRRRRWPTTCAAQSCSS